MRETPEDLVRRFEERQASKAERETRKLVEETEAFLRSLPTPKPRAERRREARDAGRRS